MPFVQELLPFVNDVFVETGTFKGDTIYEVNNNNICRPSKIISIELSDVFFAECKKRFEDNSNITIFKGNSKYDLYNVIKDIPDKITFWLDSHWSGTTDVGCDPVTVCPVLEELDQIKNHTLNTHTIMIDDIRLMNDSNSKEQGFPVNKDQIIAKLYEINPNYKIKYVDDFTAKNDVLVAYIETKNNLTDIIETNVDLVSNNEEKHCIHKYLTICSTNPQPPGLADFLRGTIALYNFSKEYGYKLLIDDEHPLFNYLKINKNIIKSSENKYKTEEFIPPLSYEESYCMLNEIFKSGRSFSALTNSFYSIRDGCLGNYGAISEDCAEYIKDILTPTIEVEDKIKYVFNNVYKIDTNDSFKVIHLRFGDTFIHMNEYNDSLYNHYYDVINKLIDNGNDENYVLISDSSEIARNLNSNIPKLLYWDNSKIHLGDLINIQNSGVLDTLVDFFIMSRSKEIISNGSGFSHFNSIIYNIKYTQF